MIGDEGREHGLGAQVFGADCRLGTGVGLDLALEASDEANRDIRLIPDEVAEEAIQVGGLHLRHDAGQVAGGFGLIPIVDLVAVENGDVFVPDLLDLLTLGKFAGLLRGQESGNLLA